MVLVSRSCSCSRAAATRTRLTILDKPVMLPVLRRDVGDVGHAEEGHQVVLAERVEGDVAHQDHLLVGVGPDGHDQGGQVLGLGEDELLVHLGHPARRLEQALAVGVLADPLEEKAGGLLDLGLVDHRSASA